MRYQNDCLTNVFKGKKILHMLGTFMSSRSRIIENIFLFKKKNKTCKSNLDISPLFFLIFYNRQNSENIGGGHKSHIVSNIL